MAEQIIRGRYRLVERLGGGAMSEVWRAEDVELERRVAVKLLGGDADRARFEREARAVATLAHPNINQLYDYGEVEGRPYMVLEYLGGGSLEERLEYGRPLPDEETARVAAEIAAGLAHAHARGLTHRDLKPANVLFDDEGRAKIGDFGIARLGGAGTLTEAGTVLGTAAYISPEQASGHPAGPASDVYSFGVILFRLLTGRLPFEADDPMELVKLHRLQSPPPIAQLRPDAPARLQAVATAALAKDPEVRPPDGEALSAELAGAAPPTAPLAATEVTQVLARPRARPSPRRLLRRAPLVAVLLLLAAAGVLLALLATKPSSHTTPPPPTFPSLSLPTVSTPTTLPPPTTQPTTHPTTTKPTTTAQTTTAPPLTLPTTVPTTTPTKHAIRLAGVSAMPKP
jgi:serine/threonine-protein kinase